MTDRISELRKMVAEATTGPWNADGPVWNRVVYSSLENRICFMAHSNGLNDDRDIANSRLIYQAPTLANDLADALGRELKLKAALEDIAKQKRTDELATEYDVECTDFEGGYDACIDKARAALGVQP